MKAVRVREFGGPEALKLEEMARPNCGPHQVLVKIKAIGVNPIDTYIRAGMRPDRSLPYTPGSDAAGVVEEIGKSVRDWKIGDRVFLSGSLTGTYTELALCENSQIHPLPSNVSFEQGAAVGVPYSTAYRAIVQKARAKPGSTLLVHGASGGVGIAALQIARALGLKVVGTAGTAEGLKLIQREGAHYFANHHRETYEQDLIQFTDGRGFDVIVEMLANVNLPRDLKLLAKFGQIVVIGNRGSVEINPREGMMRDASIHTMSVMNASSESLHQIFAGLVAGLENETLRPVIGKSFPLSEVGKAHEEILSAPHHGKIILLP